MAFASSLLIAAAGALCSVQSASQPPAVVELFTSQGCSSCPPADQWLGTLNSRYGERVIALSLHVGYWDYIGWKDPFARREFSERQRELAAANGSGVYTPGIFVQGREARDWPDARRFDAVVKAAQQASSGARLSVSVQSLSPSAVVVAAVGDGPPEARLWLALVQDASSTAVRAGENRGETLRNHHVVRAWRGPFPVAGAVQSLGFPATGEAQPAGWSVVALVERSNGATLQAVRLPLSRCAVAR